jgi:DNA-binding transcriptional MerR regulator
MFRIGEFSQIARVSGRLLRYYDSIGLLHPQRIDPATGYRYYSARQLPRLNRILVLKDLGLSLEQVGKLVDRDVGADEIRGMLLLRKTELERSLAEDAQRLRHVESRLKQIEEQGALGQYEVVVKSAPAQPFLALRATYAGFAQVFETVGAAVRLVAERRVAPDRLVVVAHSDFDDEQPDLEIGFTLDRPARPIALGNRGMLAATELPAAPQLATVVASGPIEQSHRAFGAVGWWMESNGFSITGPCREVFLDLPTPGQDAVIEIQFPVRKAAA